MRACPSYTARNVATATPHRTGVRPQRHRRQSYPREQAHQRYRRTMRRVRRRTVAETVRYSDEARGARAQCRVGKKCVIRFPGIPTSIWRYGVIMLSLAWKRGRWGIPRHDNRRLGIGGGGIGALRQDRRTRRSRLSCSPNRPRPSVTGAPCSPAHQTPPVAGNATRRA